MFTKIICTSLYILLCCAVPYFVPTVYTFLGETIVGIEALKPENRHFGTVVQPIRPTQPAVNRYTMDLNIVEHILKKIFRDLDIQPQGYKVCL